MKTSKIMVWAALALMGCRTIDQPTGESSVAIQLDLSGAATSKGSVVDLSAIENDPNGCKVYAYRADEQTGGSLIDNLSYIKSQSTGQWAWGRGAKPIWPEESAAYPARFVAVYSPHAAFFAAPLTRETIRNFEIDTKSTGNGTNEVMVATQSVASLAEGVDPVPLLFKHVLTKVRFVVTTGAGVTAKIQSVRLVHVASKRPYDMSDGLYTAVAHTPVDFGYLSAPNTRSLSGADVAVTADDGGALFMVPQNTAPWVVPSPWNPVSLTTGARVEVIYRLFVGASGTAAYKDLVGYERHATEGELFAAVSYPLDLTVSPWSAGNAYRCTIKLGTGIDNGGILVDDKFLTPDGTTTTETVKNPISGTVIAPGSPVLGAVDAPIGFSTALDNWNTLGDESFTEDQTATSIVLNPATDWLNVPFGETSRPIKVEGADWTTSIVGTGVTVTPSSGAAGSTATVTWSENTYTTVRTARIRFVATANGFGSKLLRTDQLGTFGWLPAGDWSGVLALGSSRVVRIVGSDWTAEAQGAGLSVTPASGRIGESATITWARNYGTPTPAERSGKVIFKDVNNVERAFLTTQLGGSFAFSPAGDWADVASDGAALELTITGAPNWTLALANSGGGLTVDKTSGKNGDKIKVTWASNVGVPAPPTRTGSLTFTGSDGLGTIVCNTSQLGSAPPVPIGDFVEINGVKWAVGNLVSTSSTAGPGGVGSLKVGQPTDGGVYFLFGSLIGLRGGSAASGGTGVGEVDPTWNSSGWGGTSYSKNKDILIWPTELATLPVIWYGNSPALGTNTLRYFFEYCVAPYNNSDTGIDQFDVLAPNVKLIDGGYADKGVGDPCRYYLGAPWRLPYRTEIVQLNLYLNASQPTRKGPWPAAAPYGRWVGEDYTLATKSIFIPASGTRYYYNGAFQDVNIAGRTWSETATGSATCVNANDNHSFENKQIRGEGVAARCVYAN